MTIDIHDEPRRRSSLAPRRSSTTYYRCFQNYYHAHRYLYPHPQYILGIQCKVNHWQLRDLLQVDRSTGAIYYTRADTIRELQLGQNPTSRVHFCSDYGPRCFNTNDRATVTGGVIISLASQHHASYYAENLTSLDRHSGPLKGLFSFYHPDTEITKVGKLGAMINNAVTVKQHTCGQYKAYVCNNDSNLYLLDITGDRIDVTAKINCELNTSLNNVCQSPTNDLLIVTGDSPSVFLCDPKVRNGVVQKIATDHDSGFGISYHSLGQVFSVTFQDGTCLVYDVRNMHEPTHEIKSTRPGHQSGAFRCCKFSNLNVNDLLVVLEHVGRVHLVDLKRHTEPEGHQVIVFPFALDQFGTYKDGELEAARKLHRVQHGDDYMDESDEQDTHHVVSVYGDPSAVVQSASANPVEERLQFSAPLVYDYDYVANVKPKMFKNYVYTPPPPQAISRAEGAAPNFTMPQWGQNRGHQPQECGIDENAEPLAHAATPMVSTHHEIPTLRASLSAAASTATAELHHDSYQQSYNHIDGEMELAGLAWYGNKLLIGCERGGILTWDINQMARRSFGSFSYV